MDAEYIFKLFNSGIVDRSEEEVEREVADSADHNIRMFMKYISNLKNFQLKLIAIAQQQLGPDYLKYDKENAELVSYNKAFTYISKVNLYKKSHQLDLDLINPYNLAYTLQVSLRYFEDKEDYDKVGFLYKMIDYLEKKYEDLEITE